MQIILLATLKKVIAMEMLDTQLIHTVADIYHSYVIPQTTILAQQIEDPDILGQIQDAWFNFIDSGQVWALVIGIFFGYTFKGFTG